jgi:hypothetical protein
MNRGSSLAILSLILIGCKAQTIGAKLIVLAALRSQFVLCMAALHDDVELISHYGLGLHISMYSPS